MLIQHKLPSDAEIQNQARWVVYDDDDPWNQTAADNAEWLIRFKRDVGLASPSLGPGLPISHPSWRIAYGGTGFAPPFLMPQVLPPPEKFSSDIPVTMDHKTYNIKAKTAQKFVKGLTERWQKPAQVFCSRDLESKLSEYLQAELAAGHLPSDDELRAKARSVLGMEKTAADDVELLMKFKALHGITADCIGHLGDQIPMPLIDDSLLAEFDHELNGMDLSNMDFTVSGPGTGSNSNSNSGSSGSSPEFFMQQTQGQSQSQPQSQSQMPRSKGDGPAIDYAELYRVHAATASPLRRRASAKMAARSGFGVPAPGASGSTGLGISPPRTTTAPSGGMTAFDSSLGGLNEMEEMGESNEFLL